MDYSQEYNLRTMNRDLPRASLSRAGRFLGILAGLFLLVPGLGLGLIAYVLLFDKKIPDVRGMALAGAIFSVVCWLLNLSRRLILGRAYADGGLFSPFELRVLACFAIALPALSLYRLLAETRSPSRSPGAGLYRGVCLLHRDCSQII